MIVPVSWRHAAIGVAQIEAELAWVTRARSTLWRPDGSAGLLRLTVALDAFPAEFEATHHLGMTLDIGEDEHHSVWIGADGDGRNLVGPRHCAQLVAKRLRIACVNSDLDLTPPSLG